METVQALFQVLAGPVEDPAQGEPAPGRVQEQVRGQSPPEPVPGQLGAQILIKEPQQNRRQRNQRQESLGSTGFSQS